MQRVVHQFVHPRSGPIGVTVRYSAVALVTPFRTCINSGRPIFVELVTQEQSLALFFSESVSGGSPASSSSGAASPLPSIKVGFNFSDLVCVTLSEDSSTLLFYTTGVISTFVRVAHPAAGVGRKGGGKEAGSSIYDFVPTDSVSAPIIDDLRRCCFFLLVADKSCLMKTLEVLQSFAVRLLIVRTCPPPMRPVFMYDSVTPVSSPQYGVTRQPEHRAELLRFSPAPETHRCYCAISVGKWRMPALPSTAPPPVGSLAVPVMMVLFAKRRVLFGFSVPVGVSQNVMVRGPGGALVPVQSHDFQLGFTFDDIIGIGGTNVPGIRPVHLSALSLGHTVSPGVPTEPLSEVIVFDLANYELYERSAPHAPPVAVDFTGGEIRRCPRLTVTLGAMDRRAVLSGLCHTDPSLYFLAVGDYQYKHAMYGDTTKATGEKAPAPGSTPPMEAPMPPMSVPRCPAFLPTEQPPCNPPWPHAVPQVGRVGGDLRTLSPSMTIPSCSPTVLMYPNPLKPPVGSMPSPAVQAALSRAAGRSAPQQQQLQDTAGPSGQQKGPSPSVQQSFHESGADRSLGAARESAQTQKQSTRAKGAAGGVAASQRSAPPLNQSRTAARPLEQNRAGHEPTAPVVKNQGIQRNGLLSPPRAAEMTPSEDRNLASSDNRVPSNGPVASRVDVPSPPKKEIAKVDNSGKDGESAHASVAPAGAHSHSLSAPAVVFEEITSPNGGEKVKTGQNIAQPVMSQGEAMSLGSGAAKGKQVGSAKATGSARVPEQLEAKGRVNSDSKESKKVSEAAKTVEPKAAPFVLAQPERIKSSVVGSSALTKETLAKSQMLRKSNAQGSKVGEKQKASRSGEKSSLPILRMTEAMKVDEGTKARDAMKIDAASRMTDQIKVEPTGVWKGRSEQLPVSHLRIPEANRTEEQKKMLLGISKGASASGTMQRNVSGARNDSESPKSAQPAQVKSSLPKPARAKAEPPKMEVARPAPIKAEFSSTKVKKGDPLKTESGLGSLKVDVPKVSAGKVELPKANFIIKPEKMKIEKSDKNEKKPVRKKARTHKRSESDHPPLPQPTEYLEPIDASTLPTKRPPRDFEARALRIGTWMVEDVHDGNLKGKLYYVRKGIVYEIRTDVGLFKIFIHLDSVVGFRLRHVRTGDLVRETPKGCMGLSDAMQEKESQYCLDIHLDSPPTFFRGYLQHRINTIWRPCVDFTENSAASRYRVHTLFIGYSLPPKLEKHISLLFATHSELHEVAKKKDAPFAGLSAKTPSLTPWVVALLPTKTARIPQKNSGDDDDDGLLPVRIPVASGKLNFRYELTSVNAAGTPADRNLPGDDRLKYVIMPPDAEKQSNRRKASIGATDSEVLLNDRIRSFLYGEAPPSPNKRRRLSLPTAVPPVELAEDVSRASTESMPPLPAARGRRGGGASARSDAKRNPLKVRKDFESRGRSASAGAVVVTSSGAAIRKGKRQASVKSEDSSPDGSEPGAFSNGIPTPVSASLGVPLAALGMSVTGDDGAVLPTLDPMDLSDDDHGRVQPAFTSRYGFEWENTVGDASVVPTEVMGGGSRSPRTGWSFFTASPTLAPVPATFPSPPLNPTLWSDATMFGATTSGTVAAEDFLNESWFAPGGDPMVNDTLGTGPLQSLPEI